MKPDLNPVWPWKLLEPFLGNADATVRAALLLSALLLLLLPILVWLRPAAMSRARITGGTAGVIALLVGWVLFRNADLATAAVAPLVLVPIALVALTIWAYGGSGASSPRRILCVLGLRLLAFVLAALALLRPSFAFSNRDVQRTAIVVLVDRSRSMGDVKDHGKDQSRWSALLQDLDEAGPVLKQLADEDKIDIVFRAFGVDVADFDPTNPLTPTDPRTDIGLALHKVHEEFSGRKLRAVILQSDGADTGGTYNTVDEARRWRALACPLNTFGYGNPNTPNNVRAIAITGIAAEPSPVMAKGDLTIRATIDAPGFVGKLIRVKLMIGPNEVASQDVELENSRGNDVRLKCTAPPTPGEVEVTVKVEDPRRPGMPPPGQISDARNQLSTFLTVAKEGISVLLVDRPRWEYRGLREALQDRRIHLHAISVTGDSAPATKTGDLFQFEKQQYDVIIIGDLVPKQITALNPNALNEIERLVGNKGAGFLMIGGEHSFMQNVWQNTPIEKLLPARLSTEKRNSKSVKMTPLEANHFTLKLDDRQSDTEAAWKQLEELKGYSVLGERKAGATVLAAAEDKKTALLVSSTYGGSGQNSGRTMAFAGDSTHFWRGSPAGRERHDRFWKHMILWLAKQEAPEGAAWVRPDVRRLPVGQELGFAVGLRRGDFEVTEGNFDVKLFGPNGESASIPTMLGSQGRRGVIEKDKIRKQGIYRIEVAASGKDAEGKEIKDTRDAKFYVFDDDPETTQQSADHAFLTKLAKAGNGEFHEGKDLPEFLRELRKQIREESRGHERHWPDWRTTERSPFLVVYFLLFVAVVTGEWFLRRRWGMV